MSTSFDTWFYKPSQSYTHYASIAFREISAGSAAFHLTDSLSSVNGNLFYPLQLGNK